MSKVITPAALLTAFQSTKKVDLIDVRTPAEFHELRVSFAENIPLDRLDPVKLKLARADHAQGPIYVICRSGARSAQAVAKLKDVGFDAYNVTGGTLACDKAGFPMVHGPKTISLERQVRIAAGSLVLTGVLLGIFVHPYFLGLAGFVGAGLVFAGVTDFCGMAILLGRMPWNQVASTASNQTCAARH